MRSLPRMPEPVNWLSRGADGWGDEAPDLV